MKAFVGFAGFGGVEIALHEAGIETILATDREIGPC